MPDLSIKSILLGLSKKKKVVKNQNNIVQMPSVFSAINNFNKSMLKKYMLNN